MRSWSNLRRCTPHRLRRQPPPLQLVSVQHHRSDAHTAGAHHHDLMTRGTRHRCVHHSHESPYAALMVAMAMTVTATSGGAAGSCVGGAATCTPPFYSSSSGGGINTNAVLAFGALAKPTSMFGSGGGRLVAAKHRVQVGGRFMCVEASKHSGNSIMFQPAVFSLFQRILTNGVCTRHVREGKQA